MAFSMSSQCDLSHRQPPQDKCTLSGVWRAPMKACCVVLCLFAVSQLSNAQAHHVTADYGKLSLGFEANQGQTDPRVKFLSRGGNYNVFLTDNEAVLTLPVSCPSGKS